MFLGILRQPFAPIPFERERLNGGPRRILIGRDHSCDVVRDVRGNIHGESFVPVLPPQYITLPGRHDRTAPYP